MTLFDQTRFWLPALAILTAVAWPAAGNAQGPGPDQAGPGHPPQGRPPGVIRQGQGGQPAGQPQAQQGPRQGAMQGAVQGHIPTPSQGPVAGQPGGPAPRVAMPPQPRPAAPVAQQQGRPPGAGYDRGHGYAPGPGPAAAGRSPDARYARGGIAVRDYGGQSYRGRLGWEGGRWRHEVHNGRRGWWWDVGGVWYYYDEPMDGPPTYVSEDYADDVVYAPAAAYRAPPAVEYEPAPPPADPDPAASALGGAIIGGVLGGILTGKAGGAAAGAVLGGATGAIAGATAASRPGYYLSQGNCYYRYPSGEYVAVDPRSCY